MVVVVRPLVVVVLDFKLAGKREWIPYLWWIDNNNNNIVKYVTGLM
jgi:hypothetical protein